MFDLIKHLYRQRDFSLKTFGPGKRRNGVADHIRKELAEIEADPDGKGECEWIDVIILGFDGALRDGRTPEQIVEMIVAKQTKNEGRDWPDWRTADPDKAIEHDRGGEEPALDAKTFPYGPLERDLCELACSRVEEAVHSVMQLSDTEETKFLISIKAMEQAVAMCAGCYGAVYLGHVNDPFDIAKTVLELAQRAK